MEGNEKDIQTAIKKDTQVWKFCFYGFFKNLKFFEPYLLIILLSWNLNLIDIGILLLLQEVMTYLLEVPSGVLADNYGKKTIMLFCFLFYIVSFIFYFFGEGPNFLSLFLGAIFFGLGESFRSGTHKAMEILWMEKNNVLKYSSFVYGRTRSYSLYGSAISSLLSIIFILGIPADRWIFIITTIPYVIDFFLIYSYPKYMNEQANNHKDKVKNFLLGFKNLKVAIINKRLRKALFSSSLYDAIYKSLKDYIQPIIQVYIIFLLSSLYINPNGFDQDSYVKIILGVIYSIFNIISSISSKNSWRFKKRFTSLKKGMDVSFNMFGISLFFIFVFLLFNLPLIVIFLYLIVYIIFNMRRPIVIDYLGILIQREQRATLLSAEALLKSLLVFVFSPLFGVIAEYFSFQTLFLTITIFVLLINNIFLRDSRK